MKNVTNHQRPGVYSVYEASGLTAGKVGGKTVGLVALCTKTGANVPKAGVAATYRRYREAAEAFGPEENIAEVVRLLLLNGASAVVAIPVAAEAGYAKAFTDLELLEDIAIVLCDSTAAGVQKALQESVNLASKNRRERVCVLCGAADETVTNLVARAKVCNDKRCVLAAPGALKPDGTPAHPAHVAAAVAGALAGETDPALPLGGATLQGLAGIAISYTDEELDALILGGVTVVESVGGTVAVVRAVTTATTTEVGNTPDATWRELTTILITDQVISGLRNALRARFPRAKNTEQSRGAIRSQVMLELENRKEREMITGYEGVSVTALPTEPTVCLVEFSFTVAHGLSQIWLSAHITV
ncbi:MAG: phage tail sheath subtilisin-like domain-containing protein [Oscillospiraceae bacterium]